MALIILHFIIRYILHRIVVQSQKWRDLDRNHRIHHGIFVLLSFLRIGMKTRIVNVIQRYRVGQHLTVSGQTDIIRPFVMNVRCRQCISVFIVLGVL